MIGMADAAPRATGRILLLDSDAIAQESLASLLTAEGYAVTPAGTLEAAAAAMKAAPHDLAIVDINAPDASGLEIWRYLRDSHGEMGVILITAYGAMEAAVEAMKEGARDYLTKPIIEDDLRLAVQRALERQRLMEENHRLREALTEAGGRDFAPQAGPAIVKSSISVGPGGAQTLEQAMSQMEKRMIEAALSQHSGSRQWAARQLGINRITLYKKMKRHGLMG